MVRVYLPSTNRPPLANGPRVATDRPLTSGAKETWNGGDGSADRFGGPVPSARGDTDRFAEGLNDRRRGGATRRPAAHDGRQGDDGRPAATVVSCAVVSLLASESGCLARMLAVLGMQSLADTGRTTMVTVAVARAAKVPRSTVMVLPDWVTVPWPAVAERRVTPAGSVSVRVTPVTVPEPRFVTVIV